MFLGNTGRSTLKFLCVMVLTMFMSTNAGYSQQDAPRLEAMAKGGDQLINTPGANPLSASSESTLRKGTNPYSIVIPEELGSIEEVFQGAADSPLVVHIQDAHANYEAQLNIKKILSHLSKHHQMNLIQLEGASSKLNTSVFETAYLKEANVKLADYLMREGRLSGAEAFAIESENPVELHGVENRLLYMENFKTFRSVYSHQQEIAEFFKAMRILSKDLRIKLLNEELLDLTRKMESYAGEKIELLDYLLYLNALAEKHKIASLNSMTEITRFPNLVRIIRLHDLQESLDEKSLKKEAEALKKAFSKVQVSAEAEELLAKLELKRKGMKPRVYFKKLTTLAQSNGIDLLAYPHLRTLGEFLILQDEIEHHGLFQEVNRLEKLLQKDLLKKKEERDLITALRYLDLLEQYFKLELNREKLSFIMKRFEKMKPSVVKARLDKLAEANSVLLSEFSGDAAKLDSYMNEVEYFYRVVLERDGLFVSNVVSKMRNTGAGQTVLITGGFHTDGVTSLMRRDNLSYVVVIPKVDVKQGNEAYLKIMLENESAVGSVFAGTFALDLPRNEDPSALPQIPGFEPERRSIFNGRVAATILSFVAPALALQQGGRNNELPTIEQVNTGFARFNGAQNFAHAASLGVGEYNADQDRAQYRFEIFYRNENNEVLRAVYVTTVTGNDFKTEREGEWQRVNGSRIPQNLRTTPEQPVNAQPVQTAPLQGRDLAAGVTVTPVRLDPAAVNVWVDTAFDVPGAVVPGALPALEVESRRVAREILASFEMARQNGPLAVAILETLLAVNANPVSPDQLQRQLQADLNPPAYSAVGPNVQGAAAKAVLDILSPNINQAAITAQTILDANLPSQEAKAAKIASIVEIAKNNPSAVQILYWSGETTVIEKALAGVDSQVRDRIIIKAAPDDRATIRLFQREATRQGTFINTYGSLQKRLGLAPVDRTKIWDYVGLIIPSALSETFNVAKVGSAVKFYAISDNRQLTSRGTAQERLENVKAAFDIETRATHFLLLSRGNAELLKGLEDLIEIKQDKGDFSFTVKGGIEGFLRSLYTAITAARRIAVAA